MKGGDDMKKITFAALLILAAFAVCAWSAKGSEGTRPPAEAGAPAATPTVEVVEPPQVSTEPAEPAWAEYEATAYCSCEKCCGTWAENRPDGVVYTASGAVAQEGVTIAADWDVLPPGTVVYIDGLGERVVQDRGGAIKGNAVDVYFEDHDEALVFGRQTVRLYIVEGGDGP